MTNTYLEIPKEVQLEPLFNKSYLIDGEIREWKGPTVKVYSSIHSLSKENKTEPTLLGSVPAMGEEVALQALNSAEQAFNCKKRS